MFEFVCFFVPIDKFCKNYYQCLTFNKFIIIKTRQKKATGLKKKRREEIESEWESDTGLLKEIHGLIGDTVIKEKQNIFKSIQ